MSTGYGGPPTLHGDVGLDDLRRNVLQVCTVGFAVAPFLLMTLYSRPTATPDWVAPAALALFATSGLTYAASRWRVAAGAGVATIGLGTLATAALWVPSIGWLVHLLPLLVLFNSAFFGPGGGLITAATTSAGLLLVTALGGPLSGEVLRVVLVLTWANVPVAWLGSEPIRRALDWSWTQFVRAESEADRARRHQAELAGMVKSLNLAQDRLEQANHELERARRAADEARRLKAEFAATVSHELRTPLNLIVGFSEMMATGLDSYASQPLPSTCQGDMDVIYRNARHLSGLIDDILDLAQIDASRMALHRTDVQVAALLEEAVAAVDPMLRRKGLAVSVEASPDLPPVYADRTRVRQIVVNLLGNAARFTDHGGVTVRARAQDNDLVISVSDTGVGIPPDELHRVFGEFQQIDHGGISRGGSGLGLAISKRLVELHGGSMWVESERGRGSTFCFTLPTRANVAGASARHAWETWARPTGADRREERLVAVLDVHPEPARFFQRYLDGYEVVSVPSADEIGRLSEERSVAAVLLTGSGAMDAWRRAEELRARLPETPVVVCPLPIRRRIVAELGDVDYLVKPVLKEQIGRALRFGDAVARDVLVVDDDPDMVDLVERTVRSLAPEATVRGAYGGEEGLAALLERPPDLLFLDLVMPGLDGYAVLERVRSDAALGSAVRVVLITAQDAGAQETTAEVLGFTREGGLSGPELLRTLKAYLDSLAGSVPSSGPARRAGPPG